MRELDGLEDRRVLIDSVHVKDGTSKLPGVPEERAKLGPGQDRVPHKNPLRCFKHQAGDRTLICTLSFQLHPKNTHRVSHAVHTESIWMCTDGRTHCNRPLVSLLGVTSSLPWLCQTSKYNIMVKIFLKNYGRVCAQKVWLKTSGRSDNFWHMLSDKHLVSELTCWMALHFSQHDLKCSSARMCDKKKKNGMLLTRHVTLMFSRTFVVL